MQETQTRYKICYLDPPWPYNNEQSKDPARGGAAYEKLSMNDLKALQVPEIMEHDSLIFLWCTFPKLPEGLDLLTAWGYRFCTVPFVWVKLNKTGSIGKLLGNAKLLVLKGGLYSGMGYHTCGNAEIVLLGRRGAGVPRIAKNIKQIVIAPVGSHSSKPPEVRKRIVDLLGDIPRVELFARPVGEASEQGWDMIGNEVDGRDIRDALESICQQVKTVDR